MKANRFCPHHYFLVPLITCLLLVSSGRAQTFFGSEKLTDVPAGLEAVVYPVSTMPSTLNVIFHNQIGGVVRVVIRNARGEIFYEEYAAHVRYQRRFNLASFPKGSYSVDLSEQHASGAQAFTFSIGSPGTNQIAMESPPVKLDSGKRAGMALAGNP